jgi:hypothetical protein
LGLGWFIAIASDMGKFRARMRSLYERRGDWAINAIADKGADKGAIAAFE